MDHKDLALAAADLSGLDAAALDEEALAPLERSAAALVAIDRRQIREHVGPGDASLLGLGIVKFKEHRFYSVKLGNMARDRLGALGMGGALISGGTTLGAMVAAGSLPGWAGAGAFLAITLAVVGRAKPLVAPLTLDEATTLDLAWSLSTIEQGFRLVTFTTIEARIGDVEARYRNAGFTRAKLANALERLEAIGMVRRAGGDRYQLVERLGVSDVDTLVLASG